MAGLASNLCYLVEVDADQLPLFVLCLPNEACDFDEFLEDVLDTIEAGTSATQKKYRLLVFCAAGRNRPSWPWLIQAFSKIDRRYKKALQKLYLVHEKSWVRVCMQLLETVVSPKFARKIRHVKTLSKLQSLLGQNTMDKIPIPQAVQDYDDLMAESESGRLSTEPLKDKENDPYIHKRRLDPPAVPAPRTLSRTSSTPTRQAARIAETINLPVIPPRRKNRETALQQRDLDDCIIFEDPEDESAADLAASRLEALLGASSDTKSSQRSTSAPSIIQAAKTGRLTSRVAAAPKSSRPAAFKRATSGPLTPSSAVKQNFLPTDIRLPPPKIKIHGKEVTIKTRTAKVSKSEGKVGGLAALFEERAMVAQSLR